jgi:hypothetical protein
MWQQLSRPDSFGERFSKSFTPQLMDSYEKSSDAFQKKEQARKDNESLGIKSSTLDPAVRKALLDQKSQEQNQARSE